MITLTRTQQRALDLMSSNGITSLAINGQTVSIDSLCQDSLLAEVVVLRLGGSIPCDFGHCLMDSKHLVYYLDSKGLVLESRRMCAWHANYESAHTHLCVTKKA